MAATVTIRDLMTPTVVTVASSTSLADVAREMREENLAEVLVVDDGLVRGMVTDRDIVVHGVANGLDPNGATAADVCRADLVSVTPGAGVDEAIEVMRRRAVRRIPVLDDGVPVGMLSLGDLAIARNRVRSATVTSSAGRARRR